MEETEHDSTEIDALIADLVDPLADTDYPLPERKPVKFTNVDVVVMPAGYKSEYPKPEGTKDSKARFTDSLPAMKLDLDSAEEADGVLSVPAIVAREMVYDYDGLKVLKPADELKAASLFANGIPVTREHPQSGIVTDRAEVLGFFRNPLAENDTLKGILEITDKDLIADVKDKKLTEVSPGFFCNLDRSDSGEFNGEHFDATQKEIFLNHIAIVKNGRCSIEDGCGIGLDSKKYPVPSELVDKIKAGIERAKAIKDKSLLNMLKELLKSVSVKKDSIEIKAPAPDITKLQDALVSIQAQRDTLKATLDNFVHSEGDSLGAELAALQDVKVVLDAAKDVKRERDILKSELEDIVNTEKVMLIDELTSLQDAKGKSDLAKLSLDDLRKELSLVKQLKANRLSFPATEQAGQAGQKIIDDAYRRI